MKAAQLFKRFLPRKTDYLAVDVGNGQTKIVHIDASGENPLVISMHKVNTPKGFFETQDDGKIIEFLSDSFGEAGINGKEVIASITGDKVITRYVRVPRMPDKELNKVIQFEAEKSIPIPINDLTLRYLKLGTVEVDGQQNYNLLLVAAPSELVLRYYDIFSRAGVKITILDHQLIALWRVCFGINEPEPGVSAVIDIGAAYTNLVVGKDRTILFSRTLPVGGDMLTNSMAETYGMEFDEAQKYKEEKGKILTAEEAAAVFNPEDMQIDFSLRDGLSGLTREIRRSLEYYNSQPGVVPVERLVFSGGTSKLQGFITFIADALELPANLIKYPVTVLEEDDGASMLDPSFAIAVGLALRGAGQD